MTSPPNLRISRSLDRYSSVNASPNLQPQSVLACMGKIAGLTVGNDTLLEL